MVRLAGKVRIVTPIAAFILFALLAGCGSSVQLVQMANAFLGGALSNFGGLDGDDPDARNTAREIATRRV
ncbi:hypothetical protein IIA79_01320, partial [bacterium]|nr:hypothetical protein [bacterium]